LNAFTTDYLIVGAGATGLAFADTLLGESDAHITLVDLHAKPGGHWNDAYPFVALHQPSATYGVHSMALGSLRKDEVGHNAGFYELASGAEVTGYFHNVMQQRLLPSGRVRYLPMSRCIGVHDGVAKVASVLSGRTMSIEVRKKWVDATFFSPRVPATTPPGFAVAAGVRLLTPGGLTQLWQADDRPAHYCIVGAGKTAMDVGVWLLSAGVSADAIRWVMPRDSWLIHRATTQPGDEFFEQSLGGAAKQMRALAQATSVDDLFLRMEADHQMLRIDPSHLPRMFHFATISEGEVALLRQIAQVIRRGRVQAIESGGLLCDEGRHSLPADTVYVDCTASAVGFRPNRPMFEADRITPQLLRAPLVTLSAAICAYLEAHHPHDDAYKNKLCTPVPFPHTLADYVPCVATNLLNQMSLAQDKGLRSWMLQSRLDGFGKLAKAVDPSDGARMAILGELRALAPQAMANAQRLMAAAA
jgi:hypothetical protein